MRNSLAFIPAGKYKHAKLMLRNRHEKKLDILRDKPSLRRLVGDRILPANWSVQPLRDRPGKDNYLDVSIAREVLCLRCGIRCSCNSLNQLITQCHYMKDIRVRGYPNIISWIKTTINNGSSVNSSKTTSSLLSSKKSIIFLYYNILLHICFLNNGIYHSSSPFAFRLPHNTESPTY